MFLILTPPLHVWAKKNGGRIEIQPRFKIQYPMKNQNKDALNN